MQKFNKATFAVLVGAVITIGQQFLPDVTAEVWGSAQTLLVALAVYLIPESVGMRCALLGAVGFILAACASSPLVGDTPAQQLYSLDGAHKTILELTVAYREACLKKPRALQARCRSVIGELQKADNKFFTLREGAVTDGTVTPLELTAMELAVREFQEYVARNVVQEGLQ